jgi:integrase
MAASVRGTRTLPLDTATVAALKALRKRQLEERLAAGEAYEDSGYIAADELGQPLSPERYSDEFKRLCLVAGVPVVRLHDARHSINSMLAKRGVPPHIRALWLGHTPEVKPDHLHPRFGRRSGNGHQRDRRDFQGRVTNR